MDQQRIDFIYNAMCAGDTDEALAREVREVLEWALETRGLSAENKWSDDWGDELPF